MTTVLISGGNGLVGKHLCNKLQERAYRIAILSRTRENNTDTPTYFWNVDKKEIDTEALENADYIIHLAGANIGDKRWTTKRKKLIVDSRVTSGELMFNIISINNFKPKAFISASAIGYYGAVTTEKINIEADPPASDFLGETCRLWELSADRFEELGMRTVKIRTGVVLTKQAGALEKMMTLFKLGIGSALGNGKQYIPWIHIDDLCEIYIKAIEDSKMKGAYNAVAPDHKTNSMFSEQLAHVLQKPFWFPNVPAFIIKILFGKMSEILLQGSRISSEKIIAEGYTFQFSNLQSALTDLIQKK